MTEQSSEQRFTTAFLGRYRYLGRLVESDIVLPLPVADAGNNVSLRIAEAKGPLPEEGELVHEHRAADGRLLHNVRLTREGYVWTHVEVGCFLIHRDGSRIFWRAAGSSLRDVATLLCGPVGGLAVQLQGAGLLHGNGLVRDGKALGLMAAAGSGKSTLTATLLRRGLALLSDDVLAIASRQGGTSLLPAQQSLKLWPESLRHFLPREAWQPLERYVSWLDKRVLPAQLLGPAWEEPAPLAALYIFSPVGPQEEPAVYRMRGHQALIALVANGYQARLLRNETSLLNAQLARFRALCERLPVYVLFAPRSLDRLEETATALVSHFDALTAGGS